MIRKLLLATAALAVVTAGPALAAAPKKAAKPAATATLPASNPFARPSTLPFNTPDFSRIKDSDYLPALLAGMAEQKREVLAIANNPAPPTFNNTLAALERSGQMLERAGLAFSAVNGANTNDTLQETDTKTAPLLAAHSDFINLNAKLFGRVKYLHDHQAELNLNPEQAKLLDVWYKQMVHAGAELPAAKQTELTQTFHFLRRPRRRWDLRNRRSVPPGALLLLPIASAPCLQVLGRELGGDPLILGGSERRSEQRLVLRLHELLHRLAVLPHRQGEELCRRPDAARVPQQPRLGR